MAMRPIVFMADMFQTNTEADRARSRKCLLWLMEALVQIDMLWLSAHPKTPRLYESGVRYVPEEGTEEWQDIPAIIRAGSGDCEDLSCWRTAELRRAGINARPYIKWRKIGNSWIYHALTALPDGRIEDASLALGMRGKVYGKSMFVEP